MSSEDFWKRYAANFDLGKVESIQLTCAIERLRPGEPASRWELVEGGFQGTCAFLRTYRHEPTADAETGQVELPLRYAVSASLAWCDGAEVISTTPPTGRWVIQPAPTDPRRSFPHRRLMGILSEYHFKPGRPVPPKSAVTTERTGEGYAFVVKYGDSYHHRRYECTRRDFQRGVFTRSSMRGSDGKQLADWVYEHWHQSAGVWLPRTVIARTFLDPDKPDLSAASPSPTETTTYHLLHAGSGQTLPQAMFRPSIPQGSEVEDRRFGDSLHYPYEPERTEEQLAEMARQQALKRRLRR